jgi:Tat protein translocase TatC
MWSSLFKKVTHAREKFAINLGGEDQEKPFLDHLEDLRTMVVRIAMTLLLCTFGTFAFHKELIMLMQAPMWWTGMVKSSADIQNMMVVLSPTDGFMMAMNLALVAAVIVSSPFLLLFILQFVVPGLKPSEKKMLFPAIGIGAGLFIGGVIFAYYIVLPGALKFFMEFNEALGVRNEWRLDAYIKFASRFCLLFGVAFELPVIVMILVKLDILGYKVMSTTRRYALLAIFVASAIITPTPDPFTMLVMAGPLYIMYEICIWLAYFMEKKDREAYPEYYAQLDKDEAAMQADESTTDWDKEDYNPWSSADDEDDDEAIKPRPASGTVSREDDKPKEKSLKESSSEDEERGSGYANSD